MDRVEPDKSPAIEYERDFFVWTQAQAAALRARATREGTPADIDWENVAEEIESLGRSERSAVESHLRTIVEHLLKLAHSPATLPRADWRVTVKRTRDDVADRLTASLGRGLRDTLDRNYARGRRTAALGLERDGLTLTDLPEACPWTFEQLLDEDFWPESPAA